MRNILKLLAIAVLITALSACETIGQREIVTAQPIQAKQAAIYPATALKRCPETLSQIHLSQDEWDALTGQEQIAALNRQGQAWVTEYFICATRHNIGADVYEEQLREIDGEG